MKQPEAVARFLSEARSASQIRHPRIVGASGVGVTPSGAYFIVMDLIDGPDLEKVMSRGKVDGHDAVRWIIDACEAIHTAHEQGIVHCDLKPGNLLLDKAGRIFVTDFGLARRMNEPAAPRVGLGGTAPFMTPEQVCESWGVVGPRTDVYGLGAVLFTLLAGRPPYLGANIADVLSQVAASTSPPRLSDLQTGLSSSLSSLVAQSLSKSPKERFATPLDFAAALTGNQP